MFASPFLRRRTLGRIAIITVSIVLLRQLIGPRSAKHEIQKHNVLERVTRPDKMLDVNRHDFLQVRMGRDEHDGMLSDMVQDGVQDYWERFQFPL
jgi:spore coat protein CotH